MPPLVNDIHFENRLALAPLKARAIEIPVRIKVNAGALPKTTLERHGQPMPLIVVENAFECGTEGWKSYFVT